MERNGDKVTGTIATRMSKDSAKVETALTLDFTNCTREDLIELASPGVVIDLQATYRNSSIPKTEELDVKKFMGRPRQAGGFKPTPENMADRIGKMSKEDYIKSLTLLGLDEKQATRMADKKYTEK